MFCPQTGSSCIGKQQISFQLLRERINTLHRVFGHASKEKLRAVLKGNPRYGIDPINVKLLTECHACSLGKGKKAVMPKMSTTKATKFAERISADCSGRLRIASLSHGPQQGAVALSDKRNRIAADSTPRASARTQHMAAQSPAACGFESSAESAGEIVPLGESEGRRQIGLRKLCHLLYSQR